MKFKPLLIFFICIFIGVSADKVSRSITINCPRLLFGYKETELNNHLQDSLHFLLRVMIDNPQIIMEIDAHTSYNEGSKEEKLVISKKRAESCIRYLGSKGVDTMRFKIKALGDSIPWPGCGINAIASYRTDEYKLYADSMNRRVEFKVYNFRYVPKGVK